MVLESLFAFKTYLLYSVYMKIKKFKFLSFNTKNLQFPNP
jgi:hypothetical protein